MRNWLQVSASGVSIIGLILICISVGTPYWIILEDTRRYDTVGVWQICTYDRQMILKCEDLTLNIAAISSPEVIAVRGSTIASIAITVIGFLGMLLGFEGLIPIRSTIKVGFRISAGISWIIGAGLMIAATSIATYNIIIDTMGWSLIVGWTGGFVLLLGGFLCLLSCCGKKDYTDRPESSRYPMNQYEPRPAAPIKSEDAI